MKPLIILLVIAAIAVAGYLYYRSAYAPGGPAMSPTVSPTPSRTASAAPAPSTAGQAPATHNVSIQGFAFSSSSLTVQRGDTVVFTNLDSAPHTVTAGGGAFESGTLNPNATWTLNTASLAPGTYAYHCSIHPSMQGSLTVR